MELSIYQKMLVAPLVAALLYTGFFGYMYSEHGFNREAVRAVRDSYFPALQLANENGILFDSIVFNLRDAVLAGERDWVLNTKKDKDRLDENLAALQKFPDVVDGIALANLIRSVNLYYTSAFALSFAMLEGGDTEAGRNQLIAEVNLHHGHAAKGLDVMLHDIRERFHDVIAEINMRQKRLLLIGFGLGAALLVTMLVVTFVMSWSTRRSLAEVNRAMRDIAQDDPDFSRRLHRTGSDELAELVRWFNLLSEKLEENYKEIQKLSMTDKLTQLHNRTRIEQLFSSELERVQRYGHPLSVILLDLDHFKSVNDTYGHQVGDRVLQQLAQTLRRNVRQPDHVGRWGGEEFLILSPEIDLGQATALAEKLRMAVARVDFPEVGRETASFGVASYRAGDTEDSMMKRADGALYAAKTEGRNRVVCEDQLPVSVLASG